MDGNYARRYKMVTKFGDIYDHGKDIIVGIIILCIVIKKYKCPPKVWAIFIGILAIFTILNASFIGCQARVYKDGDVMNTMRKMCPGNPRKNMKVLRYVGTGTWTIVFVLLIISLNKFRVK